MACGSGEPYQQLPTPQLNFWRPFKDFSCQNWKYTEHFERPKKTAIFFTQWQKKNHRKHVVPRTSGSRNVSCGQRARAVLHSQPLLCTDVSKILEMLLFFSTIISLGRFRQSVLMLFVTMVLCFRSEYHRMLLMLLGDRQPLWVFFLWGTAFLCRLDNRFGFVVLVTVLKWQTSKGNRGLGAQRLVCVFPPLQGFR